MSKLSTSLLVIVFCTVQSCGGGGGGDQASDDTIVANPGAIDSVDQDRLEEREALIAELEMENEQLEEQIEAGELVLELLAARDYRRLVNSEDWVCSYFDNSSVIEPVTYNFSDTWGVATSLGQPQVFAYNLTNSNSITLVYSTSNETEILGELEIIDDNVFIAQSSLNGRINCELTGSERIESVVINPPISMTGSYCVFRRS